MSQRLLNSISSTSRRIFSLDALRQEGLTVRKSSSARLPIHSLPWQFLRASDGTHFDPNTYQRTDVKYDGDSGKPLPGSSQQEVSILDISLAGDTYKVSWSDGIESEFSVPWVNDQITQMTGSTATVDRILWKDLTEEAVRSSNELSIQFEDAITAEGMSRGLQTLYQYGILLVTGTPIADEGAGVAALGAALSGGSKKTTKSTSVLANYLEGGTETILDHGTDGPLRTLYGSVWSTSSTSQEEGTSMADSAYGTEGLPLHTDMTYMHDPPGLQIFTMVQPAVEGGESVFGDGFAVADELRKMDPVAFQILSTTIRRYRCVDPVTGWNLQALGPVISTHNGRVVAIRHNDLDRLPDLPSAFITDSEEVDAFYMSLDKAHQEWDELLMQDQFRLEMRLLPGDTMVVANQRCFHGRRSFHSSVNHPRIVMGCYVSQDELSSRYREEGLEDL